jgi:3-hydroxyisobutyrate dehydrogenase-like beta-hydroxyacid dehydrogenase
MRVTILGLGNMGRAFASRALQQGHDVTTWNRTPGRAPELAAAGATDASTAAEAAAGADVVLLVVADDKAVAEVCHGPDGALAALGADAVLANVSTVSPQTARELAQNAPSGHVLDANVMGSPAAIADGLGRFLLGGTEEVVRRLEPLWLGLGAGYTYCGPAGSGATMKLMCNLLLITSVATLAEAVATARRSGLNDELLRTVFGESFVVSEAAKLRLNAILDSSHPGWFTPALARKDVRLAVGLATQEGLDVRLGPATEQLLTTVVNSGAEWPDFAAVVEALG